MVHEVPFNKFTREKNSRIARLNIVFARVNGWCNAELFGVAFALFDGLVVTAHCVMVASNSAAFASAALRSVILGKIEDPH